MAPDPKLIRQRVPLAGIILQGHLHGEPLIANELKRSLIHWHYFIYPSESQSF